MEENDLKQCNCDKSIKPKKKKAQQNKKSLILEDVYISKLLHK